MTSFFYGSPGIHFILMDSVFFVGFPFAEVLLNRRNSPGAEWIRGFRVHEHLAIFVCAEPARPASGGGGSRPSAMLGGKGGTAIKLK